MGQNKRICPHHAHYKSIKFQSKKERGRKSTLHQSGHKTNLCFENHSLANKRRFLTDYRLPAARPAPIGFHPTLRSRKQAYWRRYIPSPHDTTCLCSIWLLHQTDPNCCPCEDAL